MLVHICCSVDSHFFLQKLKEDFPGEKLIGFFYDPNIHPYSEYLLRLLDVKRSCQKLGIKLIEGEYDYESWLEAVRGLEEEPEKGKRCEVCFDKRFQATAQKALELGEKRFTTTLLVSPKKSQEQLRGLGEEFKKSHGLEFVFVDYRAKGGTQLQSRVTKEERLYRQDYCGCLFGLSKQRREQNIFMDEMMSPLSGQVLPGSIEERFALYEKRMDLEKKRSGYRIVRQKFLNYRLLGGSVKISGAVVPSYVLAYSALKKGQTRGRIELKQDGIFFLSRDEVRLMTISTFNHLGDFGYKSVRELMWFAPAFEEELAVRAALAPGPYDLSPLIVLDEILEGETFDIQIDAKTYEDVREVLVTS